MFIEIIHFGIVLLAGTISLNYNFLFKMITLDSLFGALHFMGRFIDNNLTESQIVTETNSLYSGTTLDRYIYYTMLYLFYKTAFYFFWINESFIYYYIGLITIIPFIINRILQSRLFEIIRQKKEIFVKTILAKIITNIITLINDITSGSIGWGEALGRIGLIIVDSLLYPLRGVYNIIASIWNILGKFIGLELPSWDSFASGAAAAKEDVEGVNSEIAQTGEIAKKIEICLKIYLKNF